MIGTNLASDGAARGWLVVYPGAVDARPSSLRISGGWRADARPEGHWDDTD